MTHVEVVLYYLVLMYYEVTPTVTYSTATYFGGVTRKKGLPTWRRHEGGHKPSFDKRPDLKNWQKSSRRHDRFTPLIKTPKNILAMDTVKFKAPPPMSGSAENRNKNEFCEFHGYKGHSTDKCIHLKNRLKKRSNPGNCHT
ncbi:hypothetical protein Tco_0375603 [Tanacetum coccineum]